GRRPAQAQWPGGIYRVPWDPPWIDGVMATWSHPPPRAALTWIKPPSCTPLSPAIGNHPRSLLQPGNVHERVERGGNGAGVGIRAAGRGDPDRDRVAAGVCRAARGNHRLGAG